MKETFSRSEVKELLRKQRLLCAKTLNPKYEVDSKITFVISEDIYNAKQPNL